MKDDNFHSEETGSPPGSEEAYTHETARQKPDSHKKLDRFRGKDIIDPNEAIFRIVCSIEVMDAYEKASAYYLICGHRLRYIGHDVWETLPDNAAPFPPDSAGEFLSSFNTDDTERISEKRYTRHEIFEHMIDKLKAMDLDTLAKTYHVLYGDNIDSYHGDEDRGFFIIDKHNQPKSD